MITLRDWPLDVEAYEVGVHHYADHGNGPSTVTLTLFRLGQPGYTDTWQDLESGQFWYVVRIFWPSGPLAVLDQVGDGLP